tara:strand:+ start:149 stop:604 length:456 start_codon:yes stop_codon:yes gene_type:complete
MATTVTAANLTVQIKEEITLNGTAYDQTVTHSISSIGNYMKKILPLGASASQIVNTFATSPRNNEFDIDDLKYIRVTNLDDTDAVIVNFSDSGTATAAIEILAGKSVVLFDTDISGNATGASETATTQLDTLAIYNPNASVIDVEIVIATA